MKSGPNRGNTNKKQNSYSEFWITSGTDGGLNISHNLENTIATLREQTLSVKCKWEILYVYMTIDSCGALERSSDYFQDEMVKFEVQ